jgi:hypothetical protein
MTPSHHTIAETSPTYRSVNDALREMTERFLETGVAWHKYPDIRGLELAERRKVWRSQLALLGHSVTRSYLRQVAKDFKRPFVHAETRMWGEGDHSMWMTELVIPNQKRLANITSVLTLAAKDVTGQGHYHLRSGTEGPVLRRERRSITHFAFHGETGHQIFDNWIEMCRTEPLFRIAMKNNTAALKTRLAA